MPSKITLLKAFATGNGVGGGIDEYELYPEDHDDNYDIIETVINRIIDEQQATTGANAAMILELTQSETKLTGRIGDHSALATLTGTPDTDEFTVASGPILIGGSLVQVTGAVLTATGSAGTRYIASTLSGVLTIEDAADQQVEDLWSATWDATDLSDIVDILGVMPDGDDFQDCLTVTGHASAGLPAQSLKVIADRFENIERVLVGLTTNVVAGGPALKPPAISGSASLPGITITDGSTYSTTSGLFRAAANILGCAIGATEVWRTVAGSMQFVAGTLGAPPISATDDPDTGVRFPGGNLIQLITNGVAGLFVNGDQIVSAPFMPAGFMFRGDTQACPEASITDIDFDEAFGGDFDIQSQHTYDSGTLEDRERVVLNDANEEGMYFAEFGTTIANFTGGTFCKAMLRRQTQAFNREQVAPNSGIVAVSCGAIVQMIHANGDYLQGSIDHDDGTGGASINVTFSRFFWAKLH